MWCSMALIVRFISSLGSVPRAMESFREGPSNPRAPSSRKQTVGPKVGTVDILRALG